MLSIKDQVGRTVHLKSIPKRIISLVPSQTELLCYLGLENSIIGITKYCVHPIHIKSKKTIIGGTKKVNFELIKTLNPDFIICNKEENSYDFIPALDQIAPTYYSDISTIEDSLHFIKDLGKILACRTESNNLIEKIKFKLNHFKESIKLKPIRKVAYFIWAKPWMVAGNDTYIHSLLKLNKFVNIYGHMSRYPKIELERIRFEGDPEIVFLSSEPFDFKDEHAMKIGSYTNRSTTVFVDGELFSWHGPRLLNALDYFAELHKKLDSHF